MIFGKSRAPLIVFVHVPKTAGSSVNRILERTWHRGMAHATPLLEDKQRLRARVPSLRWLSAHLAFNKFQAALEGITDREIRYFSCVRDPATQVCSHYNWLIEIFARGPAFYDPHGSNLKEVSEMIRERDNTRPSDIIQVLERHHGLFLNLQSRFLLGDDFDLSTPEFEKRLKTYDFVGLSSDITPLISVMTGKTKTRIPRENNSHYHFDPAVFQSPEIVEFMKQTNAHDQRLWDMLQPQAS